MLMSTARPLTTFEEKHTRTAHRAPKAFPRIPRSRRHRSAPDACSGEIPCGSITTGMYTGGYEASDTTPAVVRAALNAAVLTIRIPCMCGYCRWHHGYSLRVPLRRGDLQVLMAQLRSPGDAGRI